jgi:hypothetical protein
MPQELVHQANEKVTNADMSAPKTSEFGELKGTGFHVSLSSRFPASQTFAE